MLIIIIVYYDAIIVIMMIVAIIAGKAIIRFIAILLITKSSFNLTMPCFSLPRTCPSHRIKLLQSRSTFNFANWESPELMYCVSRCEFWMSCLWHQDIIFTFEIITACLNSKTWLDLCSMKVLFLIFVAFSLHSHVLNHRVALGGVVLFGVFFWSLN